MGVTGIYSFVFDIFISFLFSFMTNLLELYNSVMCCFCWYLEGQYSSFSFRIVWCWCQTLLWLQVHYSCECVTTAAESVAVTGRCEGECRLLSMFLVIFALIIFVTFTTSMPALAATLRYVLCRDVKRKSNNRLSKFIFVFVSSLSIFEMHIVDTALAAAESAGRVASVLIACW